MATTSPPGVQPSSLPKTTPAAPDIDCLLVEVVANTASSYLMLGSKTKSHPSPISTNSDFISDVAPISSPLFPFPLPLPFEFPLFPESLTETPKSRF